MHHRLFLVVFFVTAVSTSLAEQVPCLEDGCPNVSPNDPRWKSKLTQLPNYPKMRGPRNVEAEQTFKSSLSHNETTLNKNGRTKDSNKLQNILLPQHRPVPNDNSLGIDYKDTSQGHESTSVINKSSLLKIGDFNKLFVDGQLNLTNMDIRDLKSVLLSLNQEFQEGLHQLYLNRNPLGKAFHWDVILQISHMTNLKVLGLSEISLNYMLLFDHPSLEVLDLSNNIIEYIPVRSSFNMPNLRELDLSGNRLQSLYDPISSLPNLKKLSLSNNHIAYIAPEVLQSFALQELYLNNNRFETIYQDLVNPITSPNVSVYLSGNPLNCNCYRQENLLNRAWPKVADWDKLTCKARSDPELHQFDDLANECRGLIAWLKYLPERSERQWSKLHYFLKGLGVTSTDDFIIYSGLLFAILFFWLAYRMRRRNLVKYNMMSPSKATTPYTILNSNQVP